MRGELDWIVMKALEKDRTRRYETANGLARDVERYLHDEPVEACPPSASYRLRKFARKHRAALVTLAGFAAVILIAAIVSTLLAIRATTAERLASQRLAESEEARQQAEAVSRRLVAIFRRPDPSSGWPAGQGGRSARPGGARPGRRVPRGLEDQGRVTPHPGRDVLDGLGLYDRAVELLTKALSVRQAALGPDHPDTLRRTNQDAGASPFFPPLDQALIEAMACEVIAETEQPLSRQSLADLVRRAQTTLSKKISRSTVWRMLHESAIKPWQHEHWLFPKDPRFAEKAEPILDLYAGVWEGKSLGRTDYVLSMDEKTSIQARCRRHKETPPRPKQTRRIEAEYKRNGALQYLAAWDVHRGIVMGRCEKACTNSP